MKNELRKLIADYLDQQKLMQLATVKNGSPWVCSVWQAADEDLNIYFFSSITRRHSIEIESDQRIAGALALPQTTKDSPRGLQFEGTVEQLSDVGEVKFARSKYEGRIFDAESIDNFMNHEERPHRFYKITPSRFVLFDTANFPEDPRQEFNL